MLPTYGHEIKQTEDYIIRLRRKFHRHPELGGQEKLTSKRICEELERMGIPYRRVGQYGVVGTLTGDLPGKTLVLRSDMDALPVQESVYNLVREKVVVSEREGMAHVCGHDGHAAMLLGSARLLSQQRSRIRGRILFCFEEGAETVVGLQAMMDELGREQVDGVWGILLMPSVPAGCFSIEAGPRLAGAIGFQLIVRGKGGHGSRPDLILDPIACGAQIIGDVQGMIAREMNPYANVVLSFGKFDGGSIGNVIPDYCTLSGTMRFFDQAVGEKLKASFCRVIENIAASHRCQVQIDFFGRGMPVINLPEQIVRAREAVGKVVSEEEMNYSVLPQMRSDTVATYMDEFSGVFVFLGVDNPEMGTGAEPYTYKYDIDESCLIKGTAATVEYAKLFLEWE